MKKFLLSLTGFLLLILAQAQDVPHGMKYQAVARDAKGTIIANKDISLKVNLFSGNLKSPVIHYSEIHNVKTNQLGLFSLEIGSGTDVTPVKEVTKKTADLSIQAKAGTNFDKIPWSTEEIWMDVAVKNNGSEFITISSSKLQTVPYAFHARTAGKLDPVADPAPILDDREWKWDNQCECHGGLRAITLLYLGASGVKIRAYDNDHLRSQDLVDSFLNVQNGAVIRLNAQPRPDHALKSTTWMQILSNNTASSTVLSLINMPTDCDQRAIGENFGNFSVLSQVDKKDSAVCSICDVRMEWKLDGNAVFDLCNWLGTKSHHDLRIITNNLERINISKDNLMTVHDSVVVDQGRPTLLSGKLNVGGDTKLNSTLIVYGPTNMQGRLNVNLKSPTWLSGTLRVDRVTDINNYFNVNQMYPTVLSGILQTNKDALFKDHVLLDNFNHQSTSTTNGALVVAGGLGLGGNLNIGGNAKFGGETEFQGVVTVSNQSQSTNTGTGALIITGGVGVGKNLNVGEQTDISGPLNVLGITHFKNLAESNGALNGGMIVSGGVGIAKKLNVQGLTNITGNTTIAGITEINDTMNVNVGLGQVRIVGTSTGSDDAVGSYPLNIEGAKQGIWVRVNSLEATGVNNFATFQDGDGTIVGRIEGQNLADLENEPEYKNWLYQLDFQRGVDIGNVAKEGIRLIGALTAFTTCAGFGLYVCTPPVAQAVFAVLCVGLAAGQVVLDDIRIADYKNLRNDRLGVTYRSKGADYAEWLPKLNTSENFRPGDVVGVKGGFISHVTSGAEKIMVVSNKPIVLGNSPDKEKESEYRMVAFMGQVPVAVYGKVEAGDYIIASGDNDGLALAVKKNDLTPSQYKNLVGIAWSGTENAGVNYVNVAVGIGNDQVSALIERQKKKMIEITDQLNAHITAVNKRNELLATLVPGFKADQIPFTKPPAIAISTEPGYENSSDSRIKNFPLNRTDVEGGLKLAEIMMKMKGQDLSKTDLFKGLNDPAQREKLINQIMNNFERNRKFFEQCEKAVVKEYDDIYNKTQK